MRYFLILLVLIAAVAVALFTVPLENGKPMLDWQHVQENWQEPEKLFDDGVEGLVKKSEQTTLYRWRDPQGNWQYGQIPPPGVDAEEMSIQAR
ncbi:DUF4124 domain-containing protein [Alcanivorax sp. S6407]|uniref:DUF4124 domain-containing protein n=1 Tax=Alcanivorax sp. S6407 TaxID=2926424 RepID=UPI001FF6B386|nr:DUF4124 domain-containing protein [Alcanivorax sp. S6407]MCK0154763.1 DUF4124 domain-containing protein [Alcanivorax sp. S6407]